MPTSLDDILNHRASGPWRSLESKALQLVQDARQHGGESFTPILGGGTRLMLALNHRISDDIDLFVDSPAWLPYVSPRLNDRFESSMRGYNEDNAHVKLRFAEGEIDFVVAASLLPASACAWNPPAAETSFRLEAPVEVLAKKLFFRGWALTARDLFDWVMLDKTADAAISNEAFAQLLASKLQDIDIALTHMVQRESQQLSWQSIRAPVLPDMQSAAQWARERLAEWKQLARGL